MDGQTKRILIYGAGIISQFLPYVKSLTGKNNPRMCLLPTALADNPYAINTWYEQCSQMDIAGFAQRMFISSYEQKQSFEEVLLSMDAILVSGGNTLNMMVIACITRLEFFGLNIRMVEWTPCFLRIVVWAMTSL